MGKVINYSLDLETLSTSKRAVILTVGIVRLTPIPNVDRNDFYHTIAIDEQTKLGREISADTLDWWMDQPRELWKQARENQLHPSQVARLLVDFLNEGLNAADEYAVWTKGPAFDGAIVEDFLAQFHPNGDKAFSYRAHRDVRTLEMLTSKKVPRFDGAHHALIDAYHQGRFVTSALDTLSHALNGTSTQITSPV